MTQISKVHEKPIVATMDKKEISCTSLQKECRAFTPTLITLKLMHGTN
jgi:hypothetical protein